MNMKVAQPTVHEDSAEGDKHAGYLEVQAALWMRWCVGIPLYV